MYPLYLLCDIKSRKEPVSTKRKLATILIQVLHRQPFRTKLLVCTERYVYITGAPKTQGPGT